MTARVTKTSVTLSVMHANTDKPMADVVALIVKAQHKAGFVDVTDKLAAGAYRWAVNKALAVGVVPGRKAAAPKVEKAPKAPKAKAFAVKATKATKPTAPTKSAEEIERIKAANLARMKSVLARTKQTVRKDEADAETPAYADADPYASPAFLTKDEVTALV